MPDQCGSAKTQKIGKGLMGFVALVMGSCLLWIPVIGWVVHHPEERTQEEILTSPGGPKN